MNVPVLAALVEFIEGIFVHTAPTVVTAVEQAAAGAALASVQQDPKVQAVEIASVALLTAAKDLKSAIAEKNATGSSAPSSSK